MAFLASSISHVPYWHIGLESVSLSLSSLPCESDVVIIGSGYTGLNAAIETSRGGRSTLVLESGSVGFGCSTRNGGQISTSVKPSEDILSRRYGLSRARAIRAEGSTALEWIERRIAEESIDCDFVRCGRFHAAHTPIHFDSLVSDSELLSRCEDIPIEIIPRDSQFSYLGSESYFGGVLFPRHCSLDPAKYHRGLLDSALGSGVDILDHCTALSIDRTPTGFCVTTTRGVVRCGDVVIATNGYTNTSPLSLWHRRRLVPIGSYIIATDELPESLVDDLFPTNCIASDTCKVIYYFRASPDRHRIIFGGRVSSRETNTTTSALRLYSSMCRIFPVLRDYGISYSWMGTVGYTFDELAHTGCHDGIYYSVGYCGSGVSMASYLGMRLGLKVLGDPAGSTAFDDLAFPTRPFYRGTPWFLPLIVGAYRLCDSYDHYRYGVST